MTSEKFALSFSTLDRICGVIGSIGMIVVIILGNSDRSGPVIPVIMLGGGLFFAWETVRAFVFELSFDGEKIRYHDFWLRKVERPVSELARAGYSSYVSLWLEFDDGKRVSMHAKAKGTVEFGKAVVAAARKNRTVEVFGL